MRNNLALEKKKTLNNFSLFRLFLILLIQYGEFLYSLLIYSFSSDTHID